MHLRLGTLLRRKKSDAIGFDYLWLSSPAATLRLNSAD